MPSSLLAYAVKADVTELENAEYIAFDPQHVAALILDGLRFVDCPDAAEILARLGVAVEMPERPVVQSSENFKVWDRARKKRERSAKRVKKQPFKLSKADRERIKASFCPPGYPS